jgi:hypothetical protein
MLGNGWDRGDVRKKVDARRIYIYLASTCLYGKVFIPSFAYIWLGWQLWHNWLIEFLLEQLINWIGGPSFKMIS